MSMVRRSSAGLLFHQADDQEDSPVYGSHLTRRQMTKGRTQLVPTEYRDFVYHDLGQVPQAIRWGGLYGDSHR